MKHLDILRWMISIVVISACFMIGKGERLVILHTNDTHSVIDPTYDKNQGGVLRRKVLIDSVRAENANVILVDAGDAVQGSLYYTLFGGEVERKVMNALDYDIQILGNHEFDNGLDALSKYVKGINAELLSANYDFRGTDLNGIFKPYTIKTIGDKRIGFMGINIAPKDLIDSVKIDGVGYTDAINSANVVADYLKTIERVDMVVAITHIGYDKQKYGSDVDVARNSRNIDVIIGGHSHTEINPKREDSSKWFIANVVGDTVLVAQTGRYGVNVGEIDIDLDTKKIDYKLISVDSRLDDKRQDAELAQLILPYKQPVDSIRAIKIGVATGDFRQWPQLTNWMADFVKTAGECLSKGNVDLAFVNKGGVRRPIMKGDITKGNIMESFPFDNRIVVLELDGDKLAATFDSIALTKDAVNGVSRNVRAIVDGESRKVVSVTINGKAIDKNKVYRIATIDYLMKGNDGFNPLVYGRKIAESGNVIYDDMINAMEHGWLKNKKQRPEATMRMSLTK